MRASSRLRSMALLTGLLGGGLLQACGGGGEAGQWTVSGQVTGDVRQGVLVTLGGARSATAVTDPEGRYAFGGLPDGGYSLTPALAGYTFTAATRALTLHGADLGGQDFVALADARWHVGGTITGLTGQGLVLRAAGQPDLPVAPGQAEFAFPAGVASGAGYEVQVAVQPSDPAQRCLVAEGTGRVWETDVMSVRVVCEDGAGSLVSYRDGASPIAVVLHDDGMVCSGTAFVGTRAPDAPVYLLTAGHCTAITYGDEVFLDPATPPRGPAITAHFNRLLDAPAGAQFSVPVARIRYATMWGHDLSVMELATTQADLAARGVTLPVLATEVPAGGPVVTRGYRADEPLLRSTTCTLGPRAWVKEATWSWPAALRADCPLTWIRPGSSGSPVLAAGGDAIFGVVNTVSQVLDAPTCAQDQPCEVAGEDAVNVASMTYLQDATRLAGCFTPDGLFDRLLPACGLPASTFSLGPVDWVGLRVPVAANTAGTPAGTYRYKVVPLATFDPTDASGFSGPTAAGDFPFVPSGRTDAMVAVAEADYRAGGLDPLALHVVTNAGRCAFWWWAGDATGVAAFNAQHCRHLAGRLGVSQTALDAVEFPSLVTVDALTIDLNGTLQRVSLPSLTRGGYVRVSENASLAGVALPVLATVEVLSVTDNTALPGLDLPALATVTDTRWYGWGRGEYYEGGLEIARNPALTSVNLPALTAVTYDVIVDGDGALGALRLPALRAVGRLMVANNSTMAGLDLPALRTILSPHLRQPSLLQVRDNPALPQCQVDALRLALVDFTGTVEVSGNDAAATCPP